MAERPNQHEYVLILDDLLSQRHDGGAYRVLLQGRFLPISTMDIPTLVFSVMVRTGMAFDRRPQMGYRNLAWRPAGENIAGGL